MEDSREYLGRKAEERDKARSSVRGGGGQIR